MDPLLHIQESINQLTKKEQRIAYYVVDHPEAVVQMNVQEIAEKTDTSSATVIRFIKKMNYSGLSDFKVTISRHLPEDNQKVYKNIEENETIDSIKNKLLLRACYSMEMTSESLSDKEITAAVKMITEAERIIIYGIGASDIVAQDFYQKFMRLGLNIIWSRDAHFIASSIASKHDKSLVIGVSSSGENLEVIKMLKTAQKYSAATMGICSNTKSSMIDYCDHYLIHDASTEESLRLAATSSLLAQLYLIDIIFYTYLLSDFKENKKTIQRTKEAVELFKSC